MELWGIVPGLQPRIYELLSEQFKLPRPQFTELWHINNNTVYLIELLWGWNKIIQAMYLAHFLKLIACFQSIVFSAMMSVRQYLLFYLVAQHPSPFPNNVKFLFKKIIYSSKPLVSRQDQPDTFTGDVDSWGSDAMLLASWASRTLFSYSLFPKLVLRSLPPQWILFFNFN